MHILSILLLASAAGTVDITPLFHWINDLLGAVAYNVVIPGVVLWVGYLVHQHAPPAFAAYYDAHMRDSLNTALKNGTAAAINGLGAWETVHKDVAVQGAVQRMAAQYAIDHAPGALKHFGLSQEAIENKALAFIPPPPSIATDTTGATVRTVPVTETTLPPVS